MARATVELRSSRHVECDDVGRDGQRWNVVRDFRRKLPTLLHRCQTGGHVTTVYIRTVSVSDVYG